MARLLALLIVIFVIQQNQTAKISNSERSFGNYKIATISDVFLNIKYLWDTVRPGNVFDFHDAVYELQIVTLQLDIMKNYVDKTRINFLGEMIDSKYVTPFETRYKQFKEYLWKFFMNRTMNQSIRTEVAMYVAENEKDFAEQNMEATLGHNISTWIETHYPGCDYNHFILHSYIHIHYQVVVQSLETYLIHTFSSLLDIYYSDFIIDNVTSSGYVHIMESNKWLEQHLTATSAENPNCIRHEPVRISETVELEGIVQKFIAIEPDMDQSGKCYSESCPVQMKHKLLSEFSLNGYRRSKPCEGQIWGCNAVENIEICYANELIPKRYEGFRIGDRIYGNISSCPYGLSTISSWRRWIFFKCDVCLCDCIATDRDITQTQVLNHAPQTSDIEDNMVVTNVRFVEKYGTIHIQIEQEQLSLLTFSINSSSKSNWKPITDMRRSQVHVSQQTVHLDDVMVPLGHVVTGVKFAADPPIIDYTSGSYHYFRIHVRATPYDWRENKLIITQSGESSSFWVSPQGMDNKTPANERHRTFLPPFHSKEHSESSLHRLNIEDSEPNQYIAFRSSDLQDDAGQSTIPFFDSRPPFSKKPFPLSGIGISLKGYGSANGYLTLKTFPYIHNPIVKNWFMD